MTQLFKVEILGNEYTLRGDLDPGLMEKVSVLLNQRIKEVQASMPSASKVHLVILTALNIAYDYLLAKEELEQMEKMMEAKSQQWMTKLDTCTP
ncbi:MAG: cell division protein ZapA [Deltaproteobacteria bacterium]|nr:cell division protein ZapA [Deltaproteobacteria bacterium]